jgi:hypothetical protein
MEPKIAQPASRAHRPEAPRHLPYRYSANRAAGVQRSLVTHQLVRAGL